MTFPQILGPNFFRCLKYIKEGNSVYKRHRTCLDLETKYYLLSPDGAAAVSPKQIASLEQSTSDSSMAEYPQIVEENYMVDCVTMTLQEDHSSSSSVAGSEDSKMDDEKSNVTKDSNKDQSDDVFINQPSSLPDVRNLIPLRMVS